MSLVADFLHFNSFKNDLSRTKDYTYLKSLAVSMRREGKTYREILAQVPVAKSTLSVWLHDVELAKNQVQRISIKKREAQQRGAEVRRKQGIENRERTYRDFQKIAKDTLSKEHLFHIGMALYWAEGAKEKPARSGSSWAFANTDPRMIRTMLAWLSICFDIDKNGLVYEIYIHESQKGREMELREYWAKATGVPILKLEKIRYKRHNVKTNYSTARPYFGILRLTVPKSSHLVRAVEGWVQGIEYCGIV